MNKKILKAITLTISVFVISLLAAVSVNAKPLDEIVYYEITADMRENATVDFTYHISWKVLDSKSEGPLSWVKIGIPNSHVSELMALTDNIKNISLMSSGGTYVRVDFDRDYYADEIVDFMFTLNMDYMYSINAEEGIATVAFTPGWFDGIDVDNLVIGWNADNINSISPDCFVDNGYLTWQTSLSSGEKFPIKVTYPLDAYGFDLTKENDEDDGYDFSAHPWYANVLFIIIAVISMIFIVAMCFLPVAIPFLFIYIIYKGLTGYKVVKDTKITRTKIVYYEDCPNCGGSREKDGEKCEYCGTNMIKSKEVITEEEAKKLDKDILNQKTDGLFRSSSDPNTYVHVHVTHVPHIVSPPRSTTSRSGSSHHSSCAHSSCACACACACAGGGRAGCSTKDFYNTNLKLKSLKRR